MSAFITQATEVTPDWLTAVLHDSGALDPGTAVSEVEATKIGTGQMGACYALTISYDGVTDAPDRMIAKLPSEDVGSREFASSLDAYAREVSFYRDVAGDIDVRTPACFVAESAPDGKSFVLLLEDLSPALECGQIEGCTPEQARAVVEQAAALHASSWNSERLAQFEWLGSGLGMWHQFAANAAGIQQGLRQRYGTDLEAEYLSLGDTLAAGAMSRWYDRINNPRCLWHCDFRLDNLLFEGRNGEVPLAVVDWQSVTLAEGTIDLSYFIGSGLPTNLRREHEEALVRHYWSALVDRGVTDYDWDACWADYRVNAISGFMVAAVSSVSVERTERGDQMFLTMLRRYGQHMVDHDSLGLLDA